MSGKLIGIARKAKFRAPMEEVDTVGVSVELGLDGDKRGQLKKRQVSILAKEDWEAALAELGPDVDLPWTTRRANLLVEGVDLPQTKGTQLRIGSVLFEVSRETDPCEMMDAAYPGLQKALAPDWRGGILCRVLEPGDLKIGDAVVLTK